MATNDTDENNANYYSTYQIGYIEKWIPLQQYIAKHPSETRIGGIPSYYTTVSSSSSITTITESSPLFPSVAFLTCTLCQKSLYLILQIYAETDRERSLHIYGCNNGNCYQNGRVGTWRVWRTQGPIITTVGMENVHQNSTATMKTTNTESLNTLSFGKKEDHTVGGTSFDETDDWGSGGAWGSDEGIQTVTSTLKKASEEQTSLIQQQIEQTTLNIQQQSSLENPVYLSPCTPGKDTIYRFPAFAVETCEEPYDDDNVTTDDDDSDNDDENTQIDSYRKRHIGSSTSTHSTVDKELLRAQQLYEEYCKWSGTSIESIATITNNDDDDNGSNLRSNVTAAPNDAKEEEEFNDDDEDENDDGNNNEDEWKNDHPKALKSKVNTKGGDKRKGKGSNSKNNNKNSSSSSSRDDKDEKISPKLRYMLRFQKKLQKFPEQVVRYAWDGEPLWPVPPSSVMTLSSTTKSSSDKSIPTKKSSIHTPPSATFRPPPCRCGKQRKFELQLLPYILYNLHVDEYTPDILEKQNNNTKPFSSSFSPNTSTESSSSLKFNGGMDFLSVFIYSCEDSCEQNNEEYALVIPAED